MPVGAQHDAGQPDRVQALAAHVTDDDPHAVRRVQRLVQVAADVRRRGRRDVAPGHRQRADLRAERAQHRLLGDRREAQQLGDPVGLTLADGRHGGRDAGRQHDAEHVDHAGDAGDAGVRVGAREDQAGDDGEDADGQHGAPEGEDGGQERDRREQPDEAGPGAGRRAPRRR